MYHHISYIIKELFRIDWTNTFRFNFKYFPLKVAILFPCLLYRAKIIALKGRVELIPPIHTGMVRLGINRVPINQDNIGFVYENLGGCLRIGKGVLGSGSAISIQKAAKLTINEYFNGTSRAKFVCADEIVIGKHFTFGWEGLIMDTDWHSTYNISSKKYSQKSKNITIGDYVWLATGVSVMKGSKIPNYSIIAGKSLVNRQFEEECALYAGTPAKLIKAGLVRDDVVPFLK